MLEEFELREIFNEIKKHYKQCLELLEGAPPKASKTVKALLRKLHRLIQSRPDLAEKAVPILYNVCQCVVEKRYADAIGGLALLLILVATESRGN